LKAPPTAPTPTIGGAPGGTIVVTSNISIGFDQPVTGL